MIFANKQSAVKFVKFEYSIVMLLLGFCNRGLHQDQVQDADGLGFEIPKVAAPCFFIPKNW